MKCKMLASQFAILSGALLTSTPQHHRGAHTCSAGSRVSPNWRGGTGPKMDSPVALPLATRPNDEGRYHSVTVEEIARHNRRRFRMIVALSFLNYFAIAAIGIATGARLLAFVSLGGEFRQSVTWIDCLAIGMVGGFVIATFSVSRALWRFSRWHPKLLSARLLDAGDRSRIGNLLDGLAVATGAPSPRAAILSDPVPNILVIGLRSDRSTIVVTAGLIKLLSRPELEAILAVTLCSIARNDVALATTIEACTRGTQNLHREALSEGPRWHPLVAGWIATTWLANSLARRLAHKAKSVDDIGADKMAIGITRNPAALLAALVKIHNDKRELVVAWDVTASFWLEPVLIAQRKSVLGNRRPPIRPTDFRPSVETRIASLAASVNMPIPL